MNALNGPHLKLQYLLQCMNLLFLLLFCFKQITRLRINECKYAQSKYISKFYQMSPSKLYHSLFLCKHIVVSFDVPKHLHFEKPNSKNQSQTPNAILLLLSLLYFSTLFLCQNPTLKINAKCQIPFFFSSVFSISPPNHLYFLNFLFSPPLETKFNYQSVSSIFLHNANPIPKAANVLDLCRSFLGLHSQPLFSMDGFSHRAD